MRHDMRNHIGRQFNDNNIYLGKVNWSLRGENPCFALASRSSVGVSFDMVGFGVWSGGMWCGPCGGGGSEGLGRR